MAFSEDDDILQDFLVEAGEILEQLSEQLVELERSPNDHNLLNAIFRGFHTVKGGAGFLQLDAMVECCHVTENLFDILRNGKRSVTPELMDVVLQALDTVNLQFQAISHGEPSPRASEDLLSHLARLVSCDDLNEPSNVASPPPGDTLALSDAEFEGLLDAVNAPKPASTDEPDEPPPLQPLKSTPSDEITDDEFEALLDQLHGKNAAPGTGERQQADPAHSGTQSEQSAEASSAKASDAIDDDEFERLLDQLHGAGRGPTAQSAKPDKPSKIADQAASDAQPSQATSTLASPQQTASAKGAGGAPPAARAPAGGGQNQAETTVRVDTQRLDDIMNMVGELVLVRNRLVRLGLDSNDESMAQAVANLDLVTGDLQTAVMKTRMQPIKKVFGRFPRVVRDLARTLKKEIDLELIGEDTDLDKNLVEALADPLVHLVRNSVDHGIEMPSIREAAGKARAGKVVLAAQQEGDHILLTIADDGAGMDPDKLREKAVEKGLYDTDTAARLTDIEAFNLIFAPGFSTKVEISDVSGRGVGMDVVKTKIAQLNGSIEVNSKLGKGTEIIIKVPLTLAIMPTLMIMVARQCFALPLVSVNEIFQMDLRNAHVVDGQQCVTIRDKAIPIFHLKRWLVNGAFERSGASEVYVVIVSVGTRKVGFVVDQLIGQEEVVIKPLGKLLHGTPGMAGATITGDGTVALILDLPSLLKRYAGGH